MTSIPPREAAYLMAGLLAEEFPEIGGVLVADQLGEHEFLVEVRRDPGRVFRARQNGWFAVAEPDQRIDVPGELVDVRFVPDRSFVPGGAEFIRFEIAGSDSGSVLHILDSLDPDTSGRIAHHLARLLPMAEGHGRARDALLSGNPRRASYAAREAMAAGGTSCCRLHLEWLARLHHLDACARFRMLESEAAIAACRRALRLKPGWDRAHALLARVHGFDSGRKSETAAGTALLVRRD
jgi:hypothetical protein